MTAGAGSLSNNINELTNNKISQPQGQQHSIWGRFGGIYLIAQILLIYIQ